MFTKKLLTAILAGIIFTTSTVSFAQFAGPIKGESSAGVYTNLQTSPNFSQVLRVAPIGIDPCASMDTVKSNVAVNATTAATTQLVALSGTTVIYVCSFSLTISQVATTANTLKFVQGTGASCGTGTADITGLFGAGGITAAAPIVVITDGLGTKFKTAAGSALCVTTAIGGSGSFQGFVTYVQQ